MLIHVSPICKMGKSQHCGTGEEVHSGKSLIGLLRRCDMKNPQFQPSVLTKSDKYVG